MDSDKGVSASVDAASAEDFYDTEDDGYFDTYKY